MSIWSTWLTIQHTAEWINDLEGHGIKAGVIGDFSETDALGSPWVYQGSHVLPAQDDPRGGSVDIAVVPNHITRDGRDDGAEGLHDWLRLSVAEKGADDATVILDRAQVQAMRDVLDEWLREEERF